MEEKEDERRIQKGGEREGDRPLAVARTEIWDQKLPISEDSHDRSLRHLMIMPFFII